MCKLLECMGDENVLELVVVFVHICEHAIKTVWFRGLPREAQWV